MSLMSYAKSTNCEGFYTGPVRKIA